MKKNSLVVILLVLSISVFSQDAVVLSSHSSYSNINIRANTTSIPIIKFTRYTGTNNHQHNAFIGQFLNPTNGEYSFGIGTGFSTTGDQDIVNAVLTATLNGRVGVGTTNPIANLDLFTNLPSPGVYNSQSWTNINQNYFLNLQTVWDNEGINQRFIQRFNGVDYTSLSFFKGNVGVGTAAPQAKFEVGSFLENGGLGTIFGRLQEGHSSGTGTFLGVRGYETQPTGVKSFALEHSFFGQVNNSINFHRGGSVTGGFISFSTDNNSEKLRITSNGNVGIGTTSPDAKLTVAGDIHSREVKVTVDAGTGPDYVFEPDYKLPSLTEIESYIKANKHLPEVPSAKEMETNGINLSEMNMLLLRKIEELTLHLIDQNKLIDKLQASHTSADASAKKVEELTLHLIEQQKQDQKHTELIRKLQEEIKSVKHE